MCTNAETLHTGTATAKEPRAHTKQRTVNGDATHRRKEEIEHGLRQANEAFDLREHKRQPDREQREPDREVPARKQAADGGWAEHSQ